MSPESISIPPLALDTWAKMSPKAKWDALVALRGPDAIESREMIKHFSSSIIRWRLSKVLESMGTRAGGAVNTEFGVILIPHPQHGWWWNSSHYFEHVIEAASWLDIPTVRVPKDAYLNLMGIGYRSVHDGLKKVWSDLVRSGYNELTSTGMTRIASWIGESLPEPAPAPNPFVIKKKKQPGTYVISDWLSESTTAAVPATATPQPEAPSNG